MLNIKRTTCSNARCTFPTCFSKANLSKISHHFRYTIAVQLKVYVPANARICPNHANIEQWLQVNSLICHPYSEFTKAYIEEMFNFLTNSSIMFGTPESRKKHTTFSVSLCVFFVYFLDFHFYFLNKMIEIVWWEIEQNVISNLFISNARSKSQIVQHFSSHFFLKFIIFLTVKFKSNASDANLLVNSKKIYI